MKLNLVRSQKGMSLIEVMVAGGLFVILILIVASFVVSLQKQRSALTLRANTFQAVQRYVENMRTDASYYQINYSNAAVSINTFLDVSTLPYAITRDNQIVLRSACPNCTTFFGYTITPDSLVRNFYQVRCRVADTVNVGVSWDTTYYLTVL